MRRGNAYAGNHRVWGSMACGLAVLTACACLWADEPAAQALPTVGTPEAAKTDRVSNLWVETELRQVIQDISSQTGIAIICDQSVQGVLSLSVKNMPVEDCLERVCAVGGYSFVKVKDYYVVGRADPGSIMFQRVATPVRMRLAYADCDQVKLMMHSSLAQYVTYDQANGTILITAPEDARERVLEALRLIDQPGQQIAIEAIVFELSEEGAKQLGLDWQYQKSSVTASMRNLVGTVTFDATSDLATFLDVTLRAIVQDRKGQVLANPRILVMNGQDADIFVGQEKYFTLLSGQASNPYYRLESIKAGVTLKVSPQIGDDGQITLQFEPEVSDVLTETSRDSRADSDVNIESPLPVVTRRRAKTVISIRDGQTVIIGGLFREQRRRIVEKVPVLGDIPLAGAVFRTVSERKERQEVVILMTAHLANQPKVADVTARLEQRYASPLDSIRRPAQGGPKWNVGK